MRRHGSLVKVQAHRRSCRKGYCTSRNALYDCRCRKGMVRSHKRRWPVGKVQVSKSKLKMCDAKMTVANQTGDHEIRIIFKDETSKQRNAIKQQSQLNNEIEEHSEPEYEVEEDYAQANDIDHTFQDEAPSEIIHHSRSSLDEIKLPYEGNRERYTKSIRSNHNIRQKEGLNKLVPSNFESFRRRNLDFLRRLPRSNSNVGDADFNLNVSPPESSSKSSNRAGGKITAKLDPELPSKQALINFLNDVEDAKKRALYSCSRRNGCRYSPSRSFYSPSAKCQTTVSSMAELKSMMHQIGLV